VTAAPALRELANKLTAYRLVGVSGLRMRRLAGAPLAASVARLYREEPAVTVFRLERLAYERTRAALRRESAPAGLLGREDADPPPAKSLILLHTGLGMGLAEALLRPLRSRSPDSRFEEALRRFLDLCRVNSWPGYGRVAVEALGLMTRMLRPALTAPVERGLARIAPDLAAVFWHGAGRAFYFLPYVFLPLPGGGVRRALARCRREPPAEHRLDALSGLAFASAMVNLRHPGVVELLLDALGDDPEEGAAFTHGVAAALVCRRHTTPDDPAVAAFLAHRAGERCERWERWERRVRVPCTGCLERLYPRLLEEGRLDDLTRYGPLAA